MPAVQKQSNPNQPTYFQNLPLIRRRALREHGAQSLRMIERIGRKRCSISTFKKVNADVLFAFAFGHPNHRRFDRGQAGVGCKFDEVFSAQDAAGRKVIDGFVLADRDLDRRFGNAKMQVLLAV